MSSSRSNTNPIKHGLYARHFTRFEQAELRKMHFDDLRPEIGLLRALIAHITELVSKETNLEKSIWALNAISLASTRLNSLVRTQAQLIGATDPLDEALQLALAEEPFLLLQMKIQKKIVQVQICKVAILFMIYPPRSLPGQSAVIPSPLMSYLLKGRNLIKVLRTSPIRNAHFSSPLIVPEGPYHSNFASVHFQSTIVENPPANLDLHIY